MKIYNYSPSNKEYTGAGEAFESPFEPGIFLVPAHATFIEPPVYDDGLIPVFDPTNQKWDLAIDNRNVALYDIKYGNPVKISEIGVMIPPSLTKFPKPPHGENEDVQWDTETNNWKIVQDLRKVVYYDCDTGDIRKVGNIGDLPNENWTTVPYPQMEGEYSKKPQVYQWNGFEWGKNLDLVRLYIIQKIKDERYNRWTNGGFNVNGKWFHSDPFSRTQQLGLLQIQEFNGLEWKCMDETYAVMSQELARAIFAQAVISDVENFKAAEIHINMLNNIDDPEQYDYSSGWVQTYKEFSEM